MGMLFRMFAPKGLKRARRLTHPVSLLTPRPVKRAKMTVVNIANPAGAAKRAAKRSVVRKVRGRPSGRASRVSAGAGPAVAPLTRAERARWQEGIAALTPEQRALSERLREAEDRYAAMQYREARGGDQARRGRWSSNRCR